MVADASDETGDGRAAGEADFEAALVAALCHAEPEEQDRIAAALAPLIEPRIARERSALRRGLRTADDAIDWLLGPARWQARATALFSRRSTNEILRDLRPGFRVEHVILVDRSTGDLLCAAGPHTPSDDLLKAMLTFARNDRAEGRSSALRRLGGDGDALFLKSTPALLIGVAASGPAPDDVKDRFEALFARFARRHPDAMRGEDPLSADAAERIAADLAARLGALADAVAVAMRPAPWRAATLAAAAVAGLIAFGAYWGHGAWRNAEIGAAAATAAASLPALDGYPVEIDVSQSALTASGFAPSEAARAALEVALAPIARSNDRGLRLSVATPPRAQVVNSAGGVPVADIDARVAAALAPAQTAMDAQTEKLAALAQTVANLEARLNASEAALAVAGQERAALAQGATEAAGEVKAIERTSDQRLDDIAEARKVALAAIREDLAATKEAVAAARADQQDMAEAQRQDRSRLDALEAAGADPTEGERFAALEKDLTAASERLEAMAEDVAATPNALAEQLKVGLAENARADAEARAALAAEIEQDVAAATAAQSKLASRLDDALAAGETARAALGEKLEKANAASVDAAAEAKQARADVEALTSALKALETRAGEIADAGAARGADLARVEEMTSASKAELLDLNQRVDALTQETGSAQANLLQGLAAESKDKDAAVADLNAKIAELSARAQAAADKADEAAATAANLGARVETAAKEATALETRLTTAVARIQEVAAAAEAEIDPEIAKRVAALDETAAALQASMERLESDRETQATALQEAEANLAALQTQVASATLASQKLLGPDAAQTAPAAARIPADLTERLDALETRAGEAIAILDQRIDRIAQEAQPRALSPLEAAQEQLDPLRISFGSLAQPADADSAAETLKRAAEIALAMPEGMRLRIVGYADSDGTTEANRITSKRRSDWAYDELAQLGVPPSRMVSVGRGAEQLLSPDASDESPNRRVEFEAF